MFLWRDNLKTPLKGVQKLILRTSENEPPQKKQKKERKKIGNIYDPFDMGSCTGRTEEPMKVQNL